MEKVFAIMDLDDDLVAIYEERADAEVFVIQQIEFNFDEEDFKEVGVENLYDYCEYFDWEPGILGMGIVEWAVK